MSAMSVLTQIRQRPTLAYYYAQKAVRSSALRARLGHAMTALAGQQPARLSPSEEGDVVARELSHDGISFLPEDLLTAGQVAAVHAHLKGRPVIDQYDEISAYDIDGPIPRDRTKLYYRSEDLVGCRELVQLANAPVVLDAVAQVLGTRPTIAMFQAWWTLGEHFGGQIHQDDAYHRDVDDLRFVKLFAYLTDTHERNGAHSFVRGSHRSTLFTRRGSISDDDIAASFAAEDIMVVKGRAGTVFLENTWGIHRPLLATEGRRLIFSVLYALTPWVPYGPGAPTLALPAGLDPWVNRALFRV